MPLIKDESIQEALQQADIVEIIGQFVTLEKSGANFKGSSPFKEEKTPSFVVSPSKQIYKCFATGKGGNVVSFLMDAQKMTYPEAIKHIAEAGNVFIDYEDDGLSSEERMAKEEEQITADKLMRWAVETYHQQLLNLPPEHGVKQYLKSRGITPDDIIQWGLGFATSYSTVVRKVLVEGGRTTLGQNIGLITDKADKFQNRITFPLYDFRSQLLGISSRKWEKTDIGPKYINPSNNRLYNKDQFIYGLNYASKSIQEEGIADWVEGYTDVISQHRKGVINTITGCGTAITQKQVKLLSRFCKKVRLLLDGDEAGVKAAKRNIETFLKNGFHVEVAILPKDKDPDEFFIDKWHYELFVNSVSEDALILFTKNEFGSKKTAKEKSLVVNQFYEWIFLFNNAIVEDEYIGVLHKEIGLKRQLLNKEYKDFKNKKLRKARAEADKDSKRSGDLPEGVDSMDALLDGFYGIIDGLKTGYYFNDGKGSWNKRTNFVLEPLFHKKDQDDDARICKINNGVTTPSIIELPSDYFVSPQQFSSFVIRSGKYQFYGSKMELDKMVSKYLHDFDEAREIKYLGWQKSGFFAFYNAAYNGELKEYNEVGIVRHGEDNYFSPAASKIYSSHTNDDNDLFENDKHLAYIKAPISFSQWADLMLKTYGEFAYSSVVFAILSLFRDIVFKVDNNAPFLYFYGQSQSGKSKCAESISSLFCRGMSAFQLNAGTDFAFAARLERFKNVPVVLNEFDDNSVKEQWFQIIKGAYDGEGRERGRGGSKKKTETQKVNSSLILVGQYLSSRDDNSVVSRSIIEVFKKVDERSAETVANFNYLKQIEKNGLSSCIIELLQYRKELEQNYLKEFSQTFKELNSSSRKVSNRVNERVIRNYASLVTLNNFFQSKIKLPWSKENYFKWAVSKVVDISGQIAHNDVLSDFWTSLETMAIDSKIREAVHYKLLLNQHHVKVYEGGKDLEKHLQKQTHLLFIRIGPVHALYEQFKKTLGKNGMDKTSLVTYLKQREYFIGWTKSTRFKNKSSDQDFSNTTSAFVFDFSQLDIQLEASVEEKALPF